KSAIARYDLVELIRTSNRDPQIIDELRDDLSSDQLSEISAGREQILSEIISAAAPKLKELGIELLDLRFKRIKFLDEVQQRIFERMIAERRRIAEKFRSEGQGEASRILGNKERDLKEIQSDAYRQAEEIKGKADAEATAIYASAYDRDNETREFYRFLKTMETYEATLSEKDLLILSTKSDFFKFLRTPSGR
ncbi:MAG: protease modulator HflC, partial [Calditrichaeota bacterium]|nr:protease modulator HflC [Calditrichota bacterium]